LYPLQNVHSYFQKAYVLIGLIDESTICFQTLFFELQLSSILTYHVLAGKFNAKDVMKNINKNDGKVTMKAVNGGELTFWEKEGDIYISDENGNSAMVTIADVNQSNGVIHVINSVLLPK
jgi:uncharacterized surface protein with fasciclin (FAS1) repeats